MSLLNLSTGLTSPKKPAPKSNPAERCGADRRHAPHYWVREKNGGVTTTDRPSKKTSECDGCPPYYKPRINPPAPKPADESGAGR